MLETGPVQQTLPKVYLSKLANFHKIEGKNLNQRLKNYLPFIISNMQRWSRGHKARGQGQGHKKNPRPRPWTAFPRTDTLEAKDRNARGQGPAASVLQKKGLQKSFSGNLQ